MQIKLQISFFISWLFLFSVNCTYADMPVTPQNLNQSGTQSNQQYIIPATNSANVIISPSADDQKSLKQLFDKANYNNFHDEQGKIPAEIDNSPLAK